MKTIILPPDPLPSNIFVLGTDPLPPGNIYYGTLTRIGEKGMIIQEKYKCGKFKIYSIDKITSGNQWSCFSGENLEDVIRNFISFGGKVFIFDNANEFFLWLAQS